MNDSFIFYLRDILERSLTNRILFIPRQEGSWESELRIKRAGEVDLLVLFTHSDSICRIVQDPNALRAIQTATACPYTDTGAQRSRIADWVLDELSTWNAVDFKVGQ